METISEPDDWVILVCPPGAETASISHGDRAELAAWRNQLGWSLDEAARPAYSNAGPYPKPSLPRVLVDLYLLP